MNHQASRGDSGLESYIGGRRNDGGNHQAISRGASEDCQNQQLESYIGGRRNDGWRQSSGK